MPALCLYRIIILFRGSCHSSELLAAPPSPMTVICKAVLDTGGMRRQLGGAAACCAARGGGWPRPRSHLNRGGMGRMPAVGPSYIHKLHGGAVRRELPEGWRREQRKPAVLRRRFRMAAWRTKPAPATPPPPFFAHFRTHDTPTLLHPPAQGTHSPPTQVLKAPVTAMALSFPRGFTDDFFGRCQGTASSAAAAAAQWLAAAAAACAAAAAARLQALPPLARR